MLRWILPILCFSPLLASSTSPSDKYNVGWTEQSQVISYFHNSELERQWAWELLATYPFEESERVLDFGSGDGKLSAEISHFVKQGVVTGVDLSETMVEFASRRFPQNVYPNLTFVHSDDVTAGHLDIAGDYDLICAFFVLHILPDPVPVLENLRNYVQPGGTLVAVYSIGKDPALYQAVNETFSTLGIEAPWNRQSAPEMDMILRSVDGSARAFEEAGWELVSIREVDTVSAFYDRHEFANWLQATGIANWQVPRHLAEEFATRLVDRMAELDPELRQPDGSYHFHSPRIHVVATKPSEVGD